MSSLWWPCLGSNDIFQYLTQFDIWNKGIVVSFPHVKIPVTFILVSKWYDSFFEQSDRNILIAVKGYGSPPEFADSKTLATPHRLKPSPWDVAREPTVNTFISSFQYMLWALPFSDNIAVCQVHIKAKSVNTGSYNM